MKHASKIFVRKLKKQPLGRSRCGLEHNIKMDLREIGYENLDRIKLIEDKVQYQVFVNMVMNLLVPKMQRIL
jgi:hypothetical protein